jgi:hypothetical protein
MDLPDSIISGLLDSYQEVPLGNDASTNRLPSKNEVGESAT